MGIIKNLFSSSIRKKVKPDLTKLNLSMPTDLKSCEEYVLNNHQDNRVLIYYLEKITQYRRRQSTLSTKLFDDNAKDDLKDIKSAFDKLIQLGWIEKEKPLQVLTTRYTVDELKQLLIKFDLKSSGKKSELVTRLIDNCPDSTLKRICQFYSLTSEGLNALLERDEDYEHSVISACLCVKVNDYAGAIFSLKMYDDKWGFVHASGKTSSIFADYEVPYKRFQFMITYPMKELKNDDVYKDDLRAFLFVSLMRKHGDRDTLAHEFQKINNTPIQCPRIVDFYRSNRNDLDDLRGQRLQDVLRIMNKNAEEDPVYTLGLYIGKLLSASQ